LNLNLAQGTNNYGMYVSKSVTDVDFILIEEKHAGINSVSPFFKCSEAVLVSIMASPSVHM
jgi:hypothetical protein